MTFDKIRRHLRHELLPKSIAYSRVNTFSAIHGEFPRLRCDQKQHRVTAGIFVQGRALKTQSCVLERIWNPLVGDVNADASGCPFLGTAYRFANSIAVDSFHGKVTCGAFCAALVA